MKDLERKLFERYKDRVEEGSCKRVWGVESLRVLGDSDDECHFQGY